MISKIPVLLRNPKKDIDLKLLPPFRERGLAFIYHSNAVKGRKMLLHSEFGHFVGFESESRLLRVYIPDRKLIRTARRTDFHTARKKQLPSVPSNLDGLSRQRRIKEIIQAEVDMEDQLRNFLVAFASFNIAASHCMQKFSTIKPFALLVLHKNFMRISKGPLLCISF